MLNQEHIEIIRENLFLIPVLLMGLLALHFLSVNGSWNNFMKICKKIIAFLQNKINTSTETLRSLDWYSEKAHNFNVLIEEAHVIWEINLFSSSMLKKEKQFTTHLENSPWYEFANDNIEAEKIMYPILRKIYSKYKGEFEKLFPISVHRLSQENYCLYTWLQNETHIHTAVFSFLDELLYIASEASVFPRLSILWGQLVVIEVIFPNKEILLLLEKELEETPGIELIIDEFFISFRLCIAFTMEKLPNSLKEKIDLKSA